MADYKQNQTLCVVKTQGIARKFVFALKQCSKTKDLEGGRTLHVDAIAASCHTDKYVVSALINMYTKCSDMHHAQQVFDSTTQLDVVMWNSLLMGYVENGECSMAMDLFTEMDCEVTHVTYIAALKACTGKGKQFYLDKVIAIHEQVKEHGFDSHITVANTLVDIYGKCKSMQRAREVFDKMVNKDAVTWNSLLQGYVENGENSLAMELFTKIDCEPDYLTYVTALKSCAAMAGEGASQKKVCLEKGIILHEQVKDKRFISNILVANSVLDMYRKCGSMQHARKVFDQMIRKDVASWTSLMLGYVESGDCSIAVDLFTSMECEPTHITYVAVAKAYAGLATERQWEKQFCLEKGIAIHKQVKERGFHSYRILENTLVDMYRKCGSMIHAQEVFNGMLEKDVVTWNTLITGYVENGESSRAMDSFTKMDCGMTDFTYVAALKACRNLAALPVGRAVHARICRVGLEEDVVLATALVDFYAKCGNMATAETLFSSMHSRDIISWNGLASGYSTLGDSSQVFNLVKEMQELGVQMNGVTLLCILTTCSHAGLVEEGKRYFESLLEHGISPSLEHYTCMVDMLGRVNKLDEALSLVNSMPFKADSVTWLSLLGACKKWKNPKVGKVAFDALVAGNTKDAAVAHVLMGDIYTSLNMPQVYAPNSEEDGQ